MMRFWILSRYCNDMIFGGFLRESEFVLQVIRAGVMGEKREDCRRWTLTVALHLLMFVPLCDSTLEYGKDYNLLLIEYNKSEVCM